MCCYKNTHADSVCAYIVGNQLLIYILQYKKLQTKLY